MWIRVQVLPSSACLESNRAYNFSQGHTQSGASPVVRSNSTQSTGFDITVLASKGRICFINLIGIASRYASAIPLACMCRRTRYSLQTGYTQRRSELLKSQGVNDETALLDLAPRLSQAETRATYTNNC